MLVDNQYTPSTDDRIAEMKKRGEKRAAYDFKQKKALAKRCFDLKKDIFKDIKSLDPTGATDITVKMNQLFGFWTNKTRIKNHGNATLAIHMAELLDIIAIIDDHLREKEAELGGAAAHRTRSGGNNQQARKPTAKEQFYRDVLELREKVDANIRDELNDGGTEVSNLLKGLKIDPAMCGRAFRGNEHMVDPDPRHWKCPFCNHCSLIRVIEDIGLEQRQSERGGNPES